MTTESSQPTQPAPEAPQSAPAASSSSGNQKLIIILVVIAAIVGVGLWLALRDNPKKHKGGNGGHHPVALVKQIGPVLQNQSQLGLRPLTLAQPIYWAGPKKGVNYEFWRLRDKTIDVRYLPKGLKAGAKAQGKQYLIVATYPFSDAYNRLKKLSKGKGVMKNGAYIWVRPGLPTNILMAWPKVNYEVEVFHPNPQKAAQIAESGQIQPAG